MISKMYPVALLSGGLATRLRPLSEKIPKSLIDVNGTPFIDHQLRLLKNNGIEKVVICAGYLGEMIASYVGDGRSFGLQIVMSYDGDQLLGTAGAIKKASSHLGDSFFVLYGDSYLTCDFSAIQKAYELSGKDALMTVFHNNDLFDKSNVAFKNGKILAYEKEETSWSKDHIDYGLGVFKTALFEKLSMTEPHDLAAVYKTTLNEGRLAAFEVSERFYEIGSFKGLEETKTYLKERA